MIDLAHAPMEWVANNANNLPFAAEAREWVPRLIGEIRRLRFAIHREIKAAKDFWAEGTFSMNTIHLRMRGTIDNLGTALGEVEGKEVHDKPGT